MHRGMVQLRLEQSRHARAAHFGKALREAKLKKPRKTTTLNE